MNKVCPHSHTLSSLFVFIVSSTFKLFLFHYYAQVLYLFFNICCQCLLYTEEKMHKAYERLAYIANTSDGSLILIKLIIQWDWFFPYEFHLIFTVQFTSENTMILMNQVWSLLFFSGEQVNFLYNQLLAETWAVQQVSGESVQHLVHVSWGKLSEKMLAL